MKGVVVSRGAAIVHDSETRKDPVLLVQVGARKKFDQALPVCLSVHAPPPHPTPPHPPTPPPPICHLSVSGFA